MMDETQFRVVELQMIYLGRPHCHAREPFKTKLIENMLALSLPEELEDRVLAETILACGAPKDRRSELLNSALDKIEGWKAYEEGRFEEWQEGEGTNDTKS